MIADIIIPNKITIAVNARNGKKTNTTVYGFTNEYDLEKILLNLKKQFHCNGNIVKDNKFGDVIMLTGNHKDALYDFIVSEKICDEKDIIIRGV